jgi:hypothetical protein
MIWGMLLGAIFAAFAAQLTCAYSTGRLAHCIVVPVIEPAIPATAAQLADFTHGR